MSQLTVDQLADVQAACEAGAEKAAAALGAALNAELTLSVAGSGTLDPASLPEGFDAAGLIVLLDVGGAAAVVVIAESTGLLPDSFAEPDATLDDVLSTLAGELGAVLLPESLQPTLAQAGRVEQLADALSRGGLAADTVTVELTLQPSGGETTAAHLIFPLPNPGDMFIGPVAAESDTLSSDEAGDATSPATAAPPPAAAASVDDLPAYAQSLLQIKVPIEVTLASKRQPLSHILQLNTGTIIQFEKSCEELLDLEIGEHRVGRGEAVKVGDKFGIRLTSIVLPEERFGAVAAPDLAAPDLAAPDLTTPDLSTPDESTAG